VPEPPVGEADQRVEVPAGDRPDQQDDHGEGGAGRGGVLRQLQADVRRGQPAGGDPGADHGGDQ